MSKILLEIQTRLEQEVAQLLAADPNESNYCCPACKEQEYDAVWDERYIHLVCFVCLACGLKFGDPEEVVSEEVTDVDI